MTIMLARVLVFLLMSHPVSSIYLTACGCYNLFPDNFAFAFSIQGLS